MEMPCQKCHKARATVHLTDCMDGQARELHLCDACAEQEGVTLKQHSGLSTMLEKFVKSSAKVEELARIRCPTCGMTFAEFRSGGLLGCPQDYEVFEELLLPLLERAHDGAGQHVGRRPADEGGEGEPTTAQLRRELQKAVEQEEYEKAAQLRDQIAALNEHGD